MRNLSPHVAVFVAAAAVVATAPASASVVTIGGGLAQACYESALAQDHQQQSLDLCDRALTEEALVKEDKVATFVNRGIIHLQRESLKQASADFDSALALNPNQPDAWLNKAILIVRHGNAAPALPLAQKALDLQTRSQALAYFVRAMANEDSGNLTAAYHDLQRASQLDPKWAQPSVELRRFQVRQH